MRVKTALPALLFALSFFGAHAQTADTMIVHFDLNQDIKLVVTDKKIVPCSKTIS